MKSLALPTCTVTWTDDLLEQPLYDREVLIDVTGQGGGYVVHETTLRAIVDNADAIRAWLDQPREEAPQVRVTKRPGKVDPRTLPAISERASVCPDCGVKAVRKVEGKPTCGHCGWKVGEG